MIEEGLDPNNENDVKKARRQNVVMNATPSATVQQQQPIVAKPEPQVVEVATAEKENEEKNKDIIVSENQEDQADEDDEEADAAQKSDEDEDYVMGKGSRLKGKK